MSVHLERVSRNVCTILLNRPSKRNALNLATIKEFRSALNKFEEDDSLHVAIIGGKGGQFCSGYDLNEMIDSKTSMPIINNIEQMLWPLGTRLSEKITIAAIEGHAAGFGYEVALKCDFRVADRNSRMGFMNRRFSIPIMNGGTVILGQLIGLSRAKELISTGRAQPAPEAHQFGLLTHISDVGCAIGKSLNLARCLAKFDQEALLHDMRALSRLFMNGEMELLKLEREKSMAFLRECGPLEVAGKFLRGELGRHGNFDMGNLLSTEPDVTL